MNINEKLNKYFLKDEKNFDDYQKISNNFVVITKDLFIKKVYPDFYENVEESTFLGMKFENKRFEFYFLNKENTKIEVKILSGGNSLEDYKRYQEQVNELGRS